MKFAFVLFLWLLMAFVLVVGLALAVKGSPCLLCVGVIGFILAVAKVGCLTH
jgi:hypothetical protein